MTSPLHRTFGLPRAVLGRLGGRVMARTKAELNLEHLDLGPEDRVLAIGFGLHGGRKGE